MFVYGSFFILQHAMCNTALHHVSCFFKLIKCKSTFVSILLLKIWLYSSLKKNLIQYRFLTLIMPNFINGKIHLTFLTLSIIIFKGYQDENLNLVRQQYRASSDCTEVQAGRLYTGGKV